MATNDERTRRETRSQKLSRLVVGSPCEASWDGMQGDDRHRHCTACDRKVYDFERMTPREIAALVEATRGHLCGRITRTPDGRLVTRPPSLPEATPASWLSRRVSPLAAAVVTALLGLPGAAADAPVAAPAAAPDSGQGAEPAGAKPQRDSAAGAFLGGRLTDASGTGLAGAEVIARNTFDGHEQATTTDAGGRYAFDGLAAGVYTIGGQLTGFIVTPQWDVFLHPAERREVGLQAESAEEHLSALGGMIAMPSEPLRRVFEQSELVVLATAGATVVIDPTDDYSEVTTELLVTTVLKGRAGRTVHAVHAELPSGDGEGAGRLAPGTRVLALLNLRDDEAGAEPVYESADYYAGIQKMSGAEADAYEERLDALARLLRHGAADPADIVEWLVATTEEPATREDGAGELLSALGSLGVLARRHDRSVDDTADDLRAIAERFLATGGTFEGEESPALFWAFLTEAHKTRLSTALRDTPHLGDNEVTLLGLVRRWDRDAARSWLSRQLRDPEIDERLARQALRLLAEDDAELTALIAATNAEVQDYGVSLHGEPDTDKAKRLIEEKTTATEAELRRRALAVLGGGS
jgi:hypothetical protein